MWFSSWSGIGRVAASTVIAYGVMLTLVRLGGKRTISKKNASDFIITVAVGSAVATMILSKQVTTAEGLTALGTMMALQYLVVTVSTRWSRARRIVEGRPRLLFLRGRFLREDMLAEEVNDSEVYQAVRNEGLASVQDVYAVVLEIDGSFSVIPRAPDRPTALVDVQGMPDDERERIARTAASLDSDRA